MKRGEMGWNRPLVQAALFFGCMLVISRGAGAQVIYPSQPLTESNRNGGHDHSDQTMMWVMLVGGMSGWAISEGSGGSSGRLVIPPPSGNGSGNETDSSNNGSGNPLNPNGGGITNYGSNGSNGGSSPMSDPPAGNSDPPPGGDPVPEPSGTLAMGLGMVILGFGGVSRLYRRAKYM